MSWEKRLESDSELVQDHLRLRNDYWVAEDRILRKQIDGWVTLTLAELPIDDFAKPYQECVPRLG